MARDKIAKPAGETIIQKNMSDIMHESMMPYSEHVILERALPRVEDGLKPVQRRILFTMLELGNTPDKPYRKCARVVGDCLGKYHPHGDTSVYDALARMAQPFVMRGMLVDGHGNFGSIDGDSPAAMRYTEARMAPLAMEMLKDIEKDTVGFHLNFDDTQKEPDLLPGRYPNLLVNGASGIAVGLATNIPPHNLGEAIDAVIAQIGNPDITTRELMKYMPAPDFPTGGVLIKDDELLKAYETGRGKLQVRAEVSIEKGSAGRSLIVITQIPYQVNKSLMLERILKLSEEKKALLGGIYDIRDESDRTGMRAVVELKRDVDAEKVLAVLYKYSDLQTTFGVNMVAIAGGKPVQMGLKTIIGHYIAHQKDVVTRRTKYELEQAKARAHILEGLIIAVDNLDEVIRLIRSSKNPKEAKEKLMTAFNLTEIQAQAILDMRLQRLTNLEVMALRKEYEELRKLISRLEGILASEKKLLNVIVDQLKQVREKYADPRRTRIIDKPGEIEIKEEELTVVEDAYIILTRAGLIKKLAPKAFEKLKQTPDEEVPLSVWKTASNQKLMFFTTAGQCYCLPVANIPEAKPKDRGSTLAGLLPGLTAEEKLVNVLPVEDASFTGNIIFATEKGLVKRSAFGDYAIKKSRFAAINIKPGDALKRVWLETGEPLVMLASKKGMTICFAIDEIPVSGRVSAGVKGIALGPDDAVIAAFQHDRRGYAVIVTQLGYMKRCLMADFDSQARGGKGLRCISFHPKGLNGTYLAAFEKMVGSNDVIVSQKEGLVTRLRADEIMLELRGGKGQPGVVAVLDDIVVDARLAAY